MNARGTRENAFQGCPVLEKPQLIDCVAREERLIFIG